MKAVFDALVVGALLGGGLALFVGVGYFVQTVILKSPTPGRHAILTSMVLTMIGFAVAAIWLGYW